MHLPRRRCLALVANLMTVGIAGCANFGGLEKEDATQKIELTVTISGPDGDRTFFTCEEIASVGEVEDSVQTGHAVPLELTDDGTERAVEMFNRVGAAEEPGESSVTYSIRGRVETEQTFIVSQSLARAIESGDWEGQFRLQFNDREDAETVRNALTQG